MAKGPDQEGRGTQGIDHKEGETTNSLYAIVSDNVEKTGTVSYMFIIRAGMPRDELDDVLFKYGDKFGWLDTIHPTEEDQRLGHIYVFNPEYEDGFEASIPIYPEDHYLNWEHAAKTTPQCILLTDIEGFEQLEAACKKVNINLGSYRYHGTLKTS
ncbi:MAG: hypothetical protein A2W22_04165 [Candidatus Levybacteria bacterium RBG_16_35_11]|nr:MAG: hypothetical protein A2W22_04165 [Candidatus Levybacteria bacterium RBG_16_35_11]